MSDLQEESEFACPYCGTNNTLLVDLTGGKEQFFTVDCEICCRPISVTLTIGPDEVIELDAQRESD